ncbi:MAG: type IV toxin-antitoxin system AbiEi family antitoxin domain-containing protein [Candidatus Saliniplasma sp.]
MTTKIEKLYSSLLAREVVSFEEIVESARKIIGDHVDRRYVYRKYVYRLIDKGKLHRVRRGIYVVLSPIEEIEEHIADKFLIASKVKNRYFLGFHTALEFYGCSYSHYNEVYICVGERDRFDPFEFQEVEFRPVFVKDLDTGVEKKKYGKGTLRISSKERTFIDCIDRVDYAGGWEESLKSLVGLSGIDFNNILQLLDGYGKEILYRRVGYILESLKEHSQFYEHLDEAFLDELEEHITDRPRYLIQGKSGSLNRRWNLYVPDDFENIMRGI